jgi:hypothetical protein
MASGVLSSELLFGTHPGLTLPKSQTKTPDFLGFHDRMMGLEPTTFCMASA